jgi:hypothetical protein
MMSLRIASQRHSNRRNRLIYLSYLSYSIRLSPLNHRNRLNRLSCLSRLTLLSFYRCSNLPLLRPPRHLGRTILSRNASLYFRY